MPPRRNREIEPYTVLELPGERKAGAVGNRTDNLADSAGPKFEAPG